MKKLLLSFSLFVACVCGANAADNVTVNNISQIYTDDNATLSVSLSSASSTYYGIQYDVELPDGFSLAVDDDGAPVVTKTSRLDGFQTQSGQPDIFATNYRVLAYASSKIASGDGSLMSMTLKTSQTSGSYYGAITNIVLVNSDYTTTTMPDLEFTIDVSQGEIKTITLDQTATSNISTNTEAAKYSITRTINPGSWNTLILPFDLTYDEVTNNFGISATFAVVDNWSCKSINSDGNPTSININFKTFDARDGLKANTPYLIKINSLVTSINTLSTKVISSVSDENTTYFDMADDNSPRNQGCLIGKYYQSTVPAANLFIGAANTFYYSAGKTVSGGFRAYIYLPKVVQNYYDTLKGTSTATAKANIVIDSETTGIDDIDNRETVNLDGTSNAKIYNLSGQYVGNDVNSLSSGLYIQNGKKFSVK